MTDLWMFVALSIIAATAALIGSSRLHASYGIGVGGPDENLEKARQLYRTVSVCSAVTALVGGAAVFLAIRGASDWRQTGAGQAVLNILVVAALIGVIRSFAKTIYQQWSAKGSTAGLLRETLFGCLTMVLLMLALYFRVGS